MYLYERPSAPPRMVVPDRRSRSSHLCGLEAPRAGTLVLYVTPPNADDEYRPYTRLPLVSLSSVVR